MPTSWCGHVPLVETQQSKANDYCRAASGNKIHHERARIMPTMTQESSLKHMRYTMCDASKALKSVSQMCRTGHKTAFNPPWSSNGFVYWANVNGRANAVPGGKGLVCIESQTSPRTSTNKETENLRFYVAIHSPITNEQERANTVNRNKNSPRALPTRCMTNLVSPRAEGKKEQDSWETIAWKIEELQTRMAEQFEDNGGGKDGKTPRITKSRWNQPKKNWKNTKQRTQFATWCPHCMAAKNARKNRPTHGRKGRIVPNTDNGGGPTKVSMDHMHLHERVGEYRDVQHNPPYWITIGHKLGRRWAHQVPNKAVNDAAHWLPRRVLQDIENNGFRKNMSTTQDKPRTCYCVYKSVSKTSNQMSYQ